MDYKLLFVCLGNICRSPAAEGVAKHIVDSKYKDYSILIDSAGTYAGHSGELPDKRMRSAAWSRGYTLDSRSRVICRDDLDKFDMIVVMDNSNYNNVIRLASTNEQKSKIVKMTQYSSKFKIDEVPDPYYEGAEGFEFVLDILEDCCENLINNIIGDLIKK